MQSQGLPSIVDRQVKEKTNHQKKKKKRMLDKEIPELEQGIPK